MKTVALDQFVEAAARGDTAALRSYLRGEREPAPPLHGPNAGIQPPQPDYIACCHTMLQYTALHAAVEFGHLETTEFLLEHGAPIDSDDDVFGASPLHVAARNCRRDMVDLLLQAGADKTQLDALGQRASHTVPELKELLDLIELLQDLPPRIMAIAAISATADTLNVAWPACIALDDVGHVDQYTLESAPVRVKGGRGCCCCYSYYCYCRCCYCRCARPPHSLTTPPRYTRASSSPSTSAARGWSSPPTWPRRPRPR